MMQATINTDIENIDTIMAWPDNVAGDAAVVEVMQWRGTRDALLVRVGRGTVADRKALLANLDGFTRRHHGRVMRTPEAFGGMVGTIATLHWLDGDIGSALRWLAAAPEGDRMAGLLVRVILDGVPSGNWLAGVAGIEESKCLSFAAAERAAAAGFADAERNAAAVFADAGFPAS